LRSLQREIEGRRRARTDLLTFASSIEIPGAPVQPEDPDCEEFKPVETAFGAHHLLWLSCLQKVENGEIKRLMGLMPPGSAKSTYTSVLFPTHVMGRFPGTNIIVASYGSDLPRKFGRKGRSIIKQKVYQRIFSAGLSAESSAADEWALDNGSEWMGGGILSGITGNRADGVIWDDLIKGRDQADSDTIRNKTWDAYVDDLLSRKKPKAWEIGITTRWHEDDPAGRILPLGYQGQSGWVEGRDGNDWFVVCIPAIAERADDILGRQPGERIWPEWFGPDHFAPFKRIPRTWASLYQQRPAPEEGSYFKREWFKWYRLADPPKHVRKYGASDYAVTGNGGDYTVHGVAGVDPDDNLYIMDIWRDQKESNVWVEEFLNLVVKHGPLCWAEEDGQIRKSLDPFIVKRMRERKVYCRREQFASVADKPTRCRAFQARAAMGKVYLPEDAPWVEAFLSELLTFPAGRTDDQVDFASLIGRMLDQMTKGKRKDDGTGKREDRWSRAFARRNGDGNSWKTQ
jgi:predicted phage terminase large subunit-like protein